MTDRLSSMRIALIAVVAIGLVAALASTIYIQDASAAPQPAAPTLSNHEDMVRVHLPDAWKKHTVDIYDGNRSRVYGGTVARYPSGYKDLWYNVGDYKCITVKNRTLGTSWSPYSCLTLGKPAPVIHNATFGSGYAVLDLRTDAGMNPRSGVRVKTGQGQFTLSPSQLRQNSKVLISDSSRKGKWTCYKVAFDRGSRMMNSDFSDWQCGWM